MPDKNDSIYNLSLHFAITTILISWIEKKVWSMGERRMGEGGGGEVDESAGNELNSSRKP